MTTENGAKRMACTTCWQQKAYPDGFPNAAYAECWQCAWDAHIRRKHPEVVRRIRRAAKKRARRIKESDLIAAMTDAERRQVLSPGKG